MVSRVVVAYDDSDGARSALAWALELATAFPSMGITAVAVAEREHGRTARQLHEDDEAARLKCEHWLRAAQDRTARRSAESGIEITIAVETRVGFAAGQLMIAARDLRADLLIVGRNRHPAGHARIVGSTAEALARHANCAVLIVR